jgi:hypothetical protein
LNAPDKAKNQMYTGERMAGTGGTIEKRHRMVFERAYFEPIPARTEREKTSARWRPPRAGAE